MGCLPRDLSASSTLCLSTCTFGCRECIRPAQAHLMRIRFRWTWVGRSYKMTKKRKSPRVAIRFRWIWVGSGAVYVCVQQGWRVAICFRWIWVGRCAYISNDTVFIESQSAFAGYGLEAVKFLIRCAKILNTSINKLPAQSKIFNFFPSELEKHCCRQKNQPPPKTRSARVQYKHHPPASTDDAQIPGAT